MSTKTPSWLRGVTFGSNGDIYIIDNNNWCLEKNTCFEEGIGYKKPSVVKFGTKAKQGARPQDVAFVHLDNDEEFLAITTEDKTILFISTSLKFKGSMKLRGRCTGVTFVFPDPVLFPGHPDHLLFALNSTDCSLDVLTLAGNLLENVSLPQSLGLYETHCYICCTSVRKKKIVLISSSWGLFCAMMFRSDDGSLALDHSDQILSDEQFSPQGVCAAGNHVYVANCKMNRVVKMELVVNDKGRVSINRIGHFFVRSPCALDVKQRDGKSMICATTLTGNFEMLDF